MIRRLHLIIYMALLLLSGQHISAQVNTMRQIYAEADENYQIGRIDEARTLLQSHIGIFSGTLRQSAYRLLALCSLGQDNDADAEKYVSLLLKDDPYYSPSAQDPIRFVDLVEKFKSGNALTITTASNQAENIDESPVPVTLITEEMISNSGARNLKELLIAYVPGMTNVECNEQMNITMRGIYNSGQEKILIMLNGHRLNSYATNVASPDYSISLEKIKQVEVLRGPSSSLYGGVALTAVINIITKNGNDVDGLKLKGGIGNYGVYQADMLFGKRFFDVSLLAWGNIYNADGQKVNIPVEEQIGYVPVEGDIIIGGFNKKPSYDYGVTLDWKGFSFMHNTNFSKTVAPYSLSFFFAPYSYEKYMTIEGNAPGYAKTAHHTNLSYKHNFKNLNVGAGIIFDAEHQNRYLAASDVFPAELNYILVPKGTDVQLLLTDAVFQCNTWDENNIGFLINGDYSYSIGKDHHGTISFGAQYSHFELADSRNFEGDHFKDIILDFDDTKNLFTGKENSADAYFQMKHVWRNLILNAGLRYDYKKRNNGLVINEVSPRIALIYNLSNLYFKFCYSKAFVDAPYYYRNNTLDTYQGGRDLMSEYLHSWQFTLTYNHILPGLSLELNSFLNKASNLIFPIMSIYTNSGTMKSAGLELDAIYHRKKMDVRANVEWQKLIDSEFYYANEDHIYNIPSLSANLNVAYNILDNLKVYTHLNTLSKQTWFYQMPSADREMHLEDYDLPARSVMDVGAKFAYRHFGFDFSCHNLFNKKYEQGGTSIGPIRQQGRWMLFSVSYQF